MSCHVVISCHTLGIGQHDTAVYAALYRGVTRVAVKRLKCEQLTIDMIEQRLNEACLLSQLTHPNIVQFMGMFTVNVVCHVIWSCMCWLVMS